MWMDLLPRLSWPLPCPSHQHNATICQTAYSHIHIQINNYPPVPSLHLQNVLAKLEAGSVDDLPQSSEEKLKPLLSFGFDTLKPPARLMFLDTVSVLHQQDAAIAKMVWEAQLGLDMELAFRTLLRRHLISVDADGRLLVHDVILALGRAMILDPSNKECYGTRAWVGSDGVLVTFEPPVG